MMTSDSSVERRARAIGEEAAIVSRGRRRSGPRRRVSAPSGAAVVGGVVLGGTVVVVVVVVLDVVVVSSCSATNRSADLRESNWGSRSTRSIDASSSSVADELGRCGHRGIEPQEPVGPAAVDDHDVGVVEGHVEPASGPRRGDDEPEHEDGEHTDHEEEAAQAPLASAGRRRGDDRDLVGVRPHGFGRGGGAGGRGHGDGGGGVGGRRLVPADERREVLELGGLGVGVVAGPGGLVGVVPGRLEVQLAVGVGRIDALDDVDDDDRDVVPSALGVGLGDELVGGGLRIVDAGEDGDDLVVEHLVDEAVAAEQEAVAAHQGERPGVDADAGVDAERAGDDVAAGVGAGLVVGDVAGGDELLDVAVVDGDLAQPTVAQEVGAGVADVDERQLLTGGRRRSRSRGSRSASVSVSASLTVGVSSVGGSRRSVMTTSAVTVVPMPCWSGLPLAARKMLAVGLGDRPDDGVEVDAGRAEAGPQEVDGDGAGHLAGPVPAHAVGHGEDLRPGEEVVLVVGSDASRVGRRPPAQGGHYCASSTVWPTWMRSPGCSRRAPTRRLPLWNEPFVEPRSSTMAWPSTS